MLIKLKSNRRMTLMFKLTGIVAGIAAGAEIAIGIGIVTEARTIIAKTQFAWP